MNFCLVKVFFIVSLKTLLSEINSFVCFNSNYSGKLLRKFSELKDFILCFGFSFQKIFTSFFPSGNFWLREHISLLTFCLTFCIRSLKKLLIRSSIKCKNRTSTHTIYRPFESYKEEPDKRNMLRQRKKGNEEILQLQQWWLLCFSCTRSSPFVFIHT